MPNPSREIDKTYLSIDKAEERGLIHRDYLAHCLRWSHVVKHVSKMKGHVSVLDVGCGKEQPLARTLYVNKLSPYQYVGVDANPLTKSEVLKHAEWVTLLGNTDLLAMKTTEIMPIGRKWMPPNVVVCLEVLEHVTPSRCRAMLIRMRELADPEALFFFSTPCYNGSAAENHINEMTYEAFGALLESCGYNIDDHYGTFASIRDYAHLADQKTYEALSEYYDSNVLSVIFAPMFPAQSRNCIWRCSAGCSELTKQFKQFGEIAEPWSQHPDWKQLAGNT